MRYIIKHISFHEYRQRRAPRASKVSSNLISLHSTLLFSVILSFDEGRKIARELKGIDTEESYLELIKSKTIPNDDLASRLPYRPDLKYKDEWLGWDDFLIG